MAVEHSSACQSSTRPCLSCKLRGWRDGSSSLGVAIPAGWRGPSVYELERRHVAELKADGVPFERASK